MEALQQPLKLRRAVDPIPELKEYDAITGLVVDALFRRRFEAQWTVYQRSGMPLALLLVNLDGFRDFRAANDKLVVRDALARTAVTASSACRRRADLAGRVRSGEFALMLSDTNEAGARQMADTVRSAIEALAIPFPRSPTGDRLTATVGVACAVPASARFPNSLFIVADQALADGKRCGRNRVAA